MILTISTNHHRASDLGYLLHKHPDRLQSVTLSVGKAHIFYPESGVDRTTVALLLDIDPIDLVKNARKLSGKGFALGQYVNDRPYVASSFMSVALSKAFSTAMNGRCDTMPDLVDEALPFEVRIYTLPAPKGGQSLIKALFEPLGYRVQLDRYLLDEQFPDWGPSKYYTLSLANSIPLKDLLSHLYVLMPALDNDKHYFVSQNEVDKLLQRGKGWLEGHPQKEQIISRYLINLRSLTNQALARLNDPVEIDEQENLNQEEVDRKLSLHQQRLQRAFDELKKSGAKRVIDLGCGEGKLMRLLIRDKQFEKIVGMDVSYTELLKCKERLHWDDMAPRLRERLDLFQGSLMYRDERLSGYDAAAVVEVIEHLDENRLQAFERVLFEMARPKTIVLTTPNSEYNAKYEQLHAGSMRHDDHRFEWNRKQFWEWANAVAERNSYIVEITGVGESDEQFGSPSQIAVFKYGN
ncbi:MAG: 3' terminal RNA ribose 2'-O-methyltransferase Hen1 [Bacteroidota bacterium]